MLSAIRRVVIFCLALCSLFLVVSSFTTSAEAQAEAAAFGLAPTPDSGDSSGDEESADSVEKNQNERKRDSLSNTRAAGQGRRVAPKWTHQLPGFLTTSVLGTQGWQVLALVLVALVGLVLRSVLQFILRRRLAPVAGKLGASQVGHVVDAFAGPVSTLLVAGLLAAVYPGLGLDHWLEKALQITVRALSIIAVVVAFYRIVDVLSDRMAAKADETESKLDDQLVPLVRKALKIIVVLVGVLFLLQNLNVNVASLVTGLGIGGVAVALAAKDTIANFFGSLMIFIDRPFQIGDWVKIGGTDGIVEEVGFRSTRVRTFYNSLVTVPNAHFTEAAIDNLGMRDYRRTFTTLNVTYDTTPEQMQAFVEGIRAIIVANPYTRKDYYEIHFSAFGSSSLDIMLYFFFKVESWTEELAQRHNVFMEVLRLAKELKVEFAFPTQTLHVDSLAASGQKHAPPAPPSGEQLTGVVRSFGPGGEMSLPASPLLTEGYLAQTVKKAGGDG